MNNHVAIFELKYNNYFNILNNKYLSFLSNKFSKYKSVFFKSFLKPKRKNKLKKGINLIKKIDINAFYGFLKTYNNSESKVFYFILYKYLKIKKTFFKICKLRKYKKNSLKIKKKKFKRIKIFKIYNKKARDFFFILKKNPKLNFLPDTLPLLDLLKFTPKINITEKLMTIYGYIYIKSSGINTFITLTLADGNVFVPILPEYLKK